MSRSNHRRNVWVLSAALGLGACVPWARAASDTVELNKVPEPARQQIQQVSHEGTELKVHDVGTVGSHKNVFRAYFTNPAGKHMVITVSEDGTVLSSGETQSQRRKDAQTRLEQAKTDAERAQIQAELQAQRDAEDKAAVLAQQQLAAQQAAAQAAAQQAAAQISPQPQKPSPAGVNQKASPNPAKMTEQELSEEYNSTDRQLVPEASLPKGVKNTLDMETRQLKNVDFYKYTAGGKTFFSAHYDIGGDRREVCRTDDVGHLVGKNAINMGEPVSPVNKVEKK